MGRRPTLMQRSYDKAAETLTAQGCRDLVRGEDRPRPDGGSARPTIGGTCGGCQRPFLVVCNSIAKGQGPCRSCGNGRSQVKNMIRDRANGGTQWSESYTGYVTALGDDLVKIGIGDLNRAGRSGDVRLRVHGRRLDVLLWERSLLNLTASAAPDRIVQRQAIATRGGYTEVRRGARAVLRTARELAKRSGLTLM